MEWVETTGKTVEEAKDLALDQLGVAADEAEFEVLETPRQGLFGRLRGEARVRSRVRPNEVRPKIDRRRRRSERSKSSRPQSQTQGHGDPAKQATEQADTNTTSTEPSTSSTSSTSSTADHGQTSERNRRGRGRSGRRDSSARSATKTEAADMERESTESTESTASTEQVEPSPSEVGQAAVEFVDELVRAFGLKATTSLSSNDVELDISVEGEDLGLLIGPGGRTLMAVQNLTRVAAQRRLGDHDTRLRVDVAGYREKRRAALEAFAERIANEVRETGTARALEPMTSADRKIIHDVLNTIDGVVSRSEGDDPRRYVVVAPAS